ncbi:WD repeat-containing protein 75 [Intoshia linei]|uniref:WD repeat-containing protein 75 n=1 Tax=Intoshia linei TaxID=1819745 RepID=A0A177AZX3_9BILA|nr:WD repeat-containing protein 75 [Intoshia linei]
MKVKQNIIAGKDIRMSPCCISMCGKLIFCPSFTRILIYFIETGALINVLKLNHVKKIKRIYQINNEEIISIDFMGNLIISNFKSNQEICKGSLNFLIMDVVLSKLSHFNDNFLYIAYKDVKAYKFCKVSLSNRENFKLKIGKAIFTKHVCYQKNFDVGPKDRYAVCLFPRFILISDFAITKKIAYIPNNEKNSYIIIKCHHKKSMLAAGTRSGAIFLWYNLEDNQPVFKRIHWHSQMVSDLAFNAFGTHLYSVGREACLRKTSLEENDCKTLARLGSYILHCTVSLNHDIILLSHSYNYITVTCSNLKIISVIGSLRHLCGPQYTKNVLLGCRKAKYVLCSSTPGYLQTYSNSEGGDRNTQISIIGQNLISSTKKIEPVHVELAELDYTESWLITFEYRESNSYISENRLKFWELTNDESVVSLNTVIDYPHKGKIVNLKSNTENKNLDNVVVSMSKSGVFKIWKCSRNQTNSYIWHCIHTGNFDKYCPIISFSETYSIFGYICDNHLLFWDYHSSQDYTFNFDSKVLTRNFIFGRNDSTNLLLYCGDGELIVVDILETQELYKKELSVKYFVNSNSTSFIAAYLMDNTVIVFNPIDFNLVFSYKFKYYVNNIIFSPFTLNNTDSLVELLGTSQNKNIISISQKTEDFEKVSIPESVFTTENTGPLANFLNETQSPTKTGFENTENSKIKRVDSFLKNFLSIPNHSIPESCTVYEQFVKLIL